jgi:hypothetical protein
MTYKVKDINKNLLAEYESYQDFTSYVSSSLEENPDIQFFQYDVDLYERIESGSLLGDSSPVELIRITYSPYQTDIEDEE